MLQQESGMANFTEKAIKETFLSLLSERPLSQITVKDIVEKCGVNRNSFYYHFRDMKALLESIVKEDVDQIMAEHPTIDSLESAFATTIDFAEKNRMIIQHIYNSVNRDVFEQNLWKVCEYVIATFGVTAFAGTPVSAFDKEAISEYYTCQLFGVAVFWLRSGTKSDIHEKISRICELQRGMIEETIQRSLDR